MMDSSPSMNPSSKHLSLPCLGSHPPFPETLSSSISSVLPHIPSMKDCHLPSPHKVSSADVISFLKANDSIKCNDMASKGEHCPSIPKIILNTSINARNGHNALNGAVVTEAKGVLSSYPQTSTFAANLGNNGGLEDSSIVAPLKNVLGKMKGTENQCNMFENQLLVLIDLTSYNLSYLPLLVTCPRKISENSDVFYSNELKGAHHGPFMDIPTSRPVNLKYYQPFQSGNRKCVSPPMEVAEDSSKAWKNCLVGYFIEKKLPFSLVNNIAMCLWGNRGLQKVLDNDKGFFFFKFSDDEACSNVLESGPWLFAGRMVILKKWHPRLILTKETLFKNPSSKILINQIQIRRE
ncbi:hypothetical protein Dsin_024537 [Dipteronia sinensis]|uniref:DUF4283 domain-containing protein n=1 Tax=Dipteronia sinensis TaxID=43782 RepID=A0AAD9ZUM6_9ROSI|nr:hypothetical protein Dsin_024537 [Dipteronia sinensis]